MPVRSCLAASTVDVPVDEGFERWVLIRRSRQDPEVVTYYFVFAPAGTGLAELAGAAGLRWTIEECFQRAKEELGLDHCEARSWHGWHRHMTLCMAAAVFLARLPAQRRQAAGWKGKETRGNERKTKGNERKRKETKGDHSLSPPENYYRRHAERAGDTLPVGAPSLLANRQAHLRLRLVPMATHHQARAAKAHDGRHHQTNW